MVNEILLMRTRTYIDVDPNDTIMKGFAFVIGLLGSVVLVIQVIKAI